VTLYEVSQSILETEIGIIETALGGKRQRKCNREIFPIYVSISGDEGSQSPHSFKSSSFTIPTECGYCAVRGMSVNLL
jgi:hypothetical protein